MSQTSDDLVREAEQKLAEGDIEAANELFQQAHLEEAATTKSNPAAAIGLCRIALYLGMVDSAIEVLEKVLATFPEHAEALAYRGVAEEARGDFDKAIGYLERASKLNPKLTTARFNLGRMYGQKKRWKDAVHELKIAARQAPNNVQIHYNLGIACQELGSNGEAIEAFSDCIEIDPLFVDGYITLADVLVFAGKNKLAVDILENAKGLFPEEGVIYSKLAAIALRTGDPHLAGGYLKQQTEVEPENVEAWLNLGVVAIMALDFETAEQASLKAIELEPTGWKGYYQLGMVYDASNLKAKAKEALTKAIENGPEQWEPYNNLGTILMEESGKDSWQEATRLIEKAIQLGPTKDPHVPLYNLALLYWKLDQKDKSKIAAEGAIEVGPPGDSVTLDAIRFLGNFE